MLCAYVPKVPTVTYTAAPSAMTLIIYTEIRGWSNSRVNAGLVLEPVSQMHELLNVYHVGWCFKSRI